MLYVFEIIRKKSTTLQKGKELPSGWGKTIQQETLGTQYYAQTVELSEGHRHKVFLDNWAVSQEFRDEILKRRVDLRDRCQVIGVQTQMQSFNFFFGIQVGVLVLRHTDYSSSTLWYAHMYMFYYKA